MIKNWLSKKHDQLVTGVQAWLDRPLQDRRRDRQTAILAADRERPWTAQPLTAVGRVDPVTTLPRTPLRQPAPPRPGRQTFTAKIRNEAVQVSRETLDMLKSMDRVFLDTLNENLGGNKIDWLGVRTDRRMARNQGTVLKQRREMFQPDVVDRLAEGTTDEAAFIQAQAAQIVARAKHASDPNSADTTTFARISA